MEPVTMAFIFFMGVGLGSEINNTNEDVNLLTEQVDRLEGMVLRLAGSHAAVSARTKTNDENHEKRLNYLDEKINALHP